MVIAAMLGAIPAGPAGAAANYRSASSTSQAPALNAPYFVGWAVYDVDAVAHQLASATGTQFAPVTTSTYPGVVLVDSDGNDSPPQPVTLKTTFSVRGGPFFEVVQASPAIGPWSASTSQSTSVLGYAVDNVSASSAPLYKAHMKLVAYSGSSFAFFQGTDGIIIELIQKQLVPSQSSVNRSPAPIDFGNTLHVDYAVCDRGAVRSQLTTALGFGWQDPISLTPMFTFTPGGTVQGTALVDFSLISGPGVELETNTPQIGPFACTATSSSFHPGWEASPNVGPWQDQLLAAGEQHMADVDNLVFWDQGLGGIQLEVFDPSVG